jgi:hypothetical protein
MKEFTTAAADIPAPEADPQDTHEALYSLEFTLVREYSDGRPPEKTLCRARKPKDGQLAVLMATSSRHSSTSEQIAGYINFFVAVLDDFSHTYVVSRLLDSDDEFGIDEVQDIMEWMVEEWSGRPTQSPSVSAQSHSNGGQKSTLPTPVST